MSSARVRPSVELTTVVFVFFFTTLEIVVSSLPASAASSTVQKPVLKLHVVNYIEATKYRV